MSTDQEKVAVIEHQLKRCRQLEHEYPDGLTALNLRELERELLQRLQEMAKK